MITAGSRVGVAPGVLFRDLGGEAVLLDVSSGSYFGLNEVGTRIWRLLEGGGTVAAALDALEAEYDAPRETLRADAVALVEELLASKLLILEDG